MKRKKSQKCYRTILSASDGEGRIYERAWIEIGRESFPHCQRRIFFFSRIVGCTVHIGRCEQEQKAATANEYSAFQGWEFIYFCCAIHGIFWFQCEAQLNAWREKKYYELVERYIKVWFLVFFHPMAVASRFTVVPIGPVVALAWALHHAESE